MVVSPAIYYRLIYHRQLKLLEGTTIMLIVLAGIILITAYIDIILREAVDDVIILGEPLLAGYFYDLLQEVGKNHLKLRLIIAPKETCFGYYITFGDKRRLLWTRSTRQSCNLRFPEPKIEEFKYLAEKYGLDEEDLVETWNTFKEECHNYPQHPLFNRYCQEHNFEERQLYSYRLPLSEERRRRKIETEKVKIDPYSSGLHYLTVNKKRIIGRMIFCINPEQEYLFRKFQDVNYPSALRLRQKYFSKTQEIRDGTFICLKDDYFDYSRDEGISMTQLSTKIPLRSYQCNEIINSSSSGNVFGFSDLIFIYPEIEQLYLPWKPSSSIIVLDCCNIETTSSERDLIILLRALVKMLVNGEKS